MPEELQTTQEEPLFAPLRRLRQVAQVAEVRLYLVRHRFDEL